MSVTQIAEAIGMNRISVARYLDVLRTSGQVDMEPYGQAKVYYLSQRVPISAMLNFSSDMVVVLSKEQRIIEANTNFTRIFNLPRDKILDKPIQNVLHPITPDLSIQKKIDSALEGEEVVEEIRVLKDHEELFFRMKIVPTAFTDGSPGITILLEDITEQKRSVDALIESETKFRMLFNNANDSIILHALDDEGHPDGFLEVNDVACRNLGYSREELLAMTVEEINAPESLDQLPAIFERLFSKGHATFEEVQIRKDGSAIPVETSSHLFELNQKLVVISISRDITERKEMQKREREAFRQIEKNLEQFLTLTNHIRNPLSVIVAYEDMLPSEASEKILEQARIINDILTQLDCGWLESVEVRDFLKRRFQLYEETQES
ncbi:MAG: PAS domain S-box protein [Methanomicrobiales archaeon]|nr:PAS domain S-box protein [Methanomicrobiales archaeon]